MKQPLTDYISFLAGYGGQVPNVFGCQVFILEITRRIGRKKSLKLVIGQKGDQRQATYADPQWPAGTNIDQDSSNGKFPFDSVDTQDIITRTNQQKNCVP